MHGQDVGFFHWTSDSLAKRAINYKGIKGIDFKVVRGHKNKTKTTNLLELVSDCMTSKEADVNTIARRVMKRIKGRVELFNKLPTE